MSRLRLHQAGFAATVFFLLPLVEEAAADKPTGVPGLPPAAQARVDYARDIRPLLAARCLRCHGAKKAESGLRLDRKASAFAGGASGPAFEPGKSAQSLLIRYVAGLDEHYVMPPEGRRLTEREVGLLRAWIDQGVDWPSSDDAVGSPQRAHWAFQPPVRPRVPDIRNTAWVRNAVDRFILARLEQEGIYPAPEADRATLVRRLSLDLLGLPPSPAEVDRFVAETAPDAYERLVARLMASPHYGERWGRHWLDAARYADSDGYNLDKPRSIWKYRDWVIEAVNCDLPFDRFTIEQIAGDLLPDATVDQKIATGFHRNTLMNTEGGTDPEQFRVQAVVDRVNTTGSVFLGLTLGCAQCHDHKFDPFSQREYFQLFAFFNNADEPVLEVGTPDPSRITTLVVQERAQPRHTFVHVRGDFTRPGVRVFPGVPAALPRLAPSPSANRLDLARWLVSSEQPLTARVAVNRVWQQYFGAGLVETDNDFGSQGLPPSHPELLDWLATELVRQQWSLKALHRLIVTSATYRQSSRQRPELARVDPRNRLLARQNRWRLEAEVVRDVALAVSGLFSTKIGGPSVFPPQPDGVLSFTQRASIWRTSPGADGFRRGLYTHFWRSAPHPALAAFDAPEATTACTRRSRSNTPLQALILLNDETFFQAAQALAQRVLREAGPGDAERLDHLSRLGLARSLTTREQQRLCRLLAELRAGGQDQAAHTIVARVVLNLDEFISRE